MLESSYRDLVVMFSVGIGLLILGGIQLLARRRSLYVQLGTGTGVALLCAAGPFVLGFPAASAASGAIMIAVTLVLSIAHSDRLAHTAQSLVRLVNRSTIRAAALLMLGATVALGAAVRLEAEEEASFDRDTAHMMNIMSQPALRPADSATANTDRGRSVYLATPTEIRPLDVRMAADRDRLASMGLTERVIRLTAASDDCNCHGWVFTGGRFWVSEVDVEHILVDNGYQQVSQPRPGDLVIYRIAGQISHTGVVRAVSEGLSVLVEGKWAWMGVFLHPVESSSYGKDFAYYRSPRQGHVLAGLEKRSSTPATWAAE